MNVYVGGDVSKGYADFCLMDDDGEILLELQLDDTRQGHKRMDALIRECSRKVGAEEKLEVALEATGGMERNWLDLFRKLDEGDGANLKVYRFNPLVIRRFAEQRLHTNKTDEISARVLADYLRLGLAEKKAIYTDEGPDDGLKTLARKTQRTVNQSVDLKNELQALLQRAHPELVQHVRGHISKWVLRLISQYPTPDQILKAGPEALSEIPYVTEEKARSIVEAARTSVASQTDEDTALTLSLTAEDLLRLEKRIDRLKERLRPSRWPEPGSRPACSPSSRFHRGDWKMERSGSLLRDWRRHPVLFSEEANRVCRPRSAARRERGYCP